MLAMLRFNSTDDTIAGAAAELDLKSTRSVRRQFVQVDLGLSDSLVRGCGDELINRAISLIQLLRSKGVTEQAHMDVGLFEEDFVPWRSIAFSASTLRLLADSDIGLIVSPYGKSRHAETPKRGSARGASVL